MPFQMRRGEPNRKANIWTARFIPLLLVGIIGYASFVVTNLSINYLINPSPSLLLPSRTASAISILTIFYLLFLMLLVSYARLVQTIITNPGTVPRGPQWYAEQERKSKARRFGSDKEASVDTDSSDGYGKLSKSKTQGQADEEASKVQDFWLKDVFVCKYDGRPPYCTHCCNYKPTRSHHCSELNRCIYKMDHFCPWVGGIVSETSFKCFIIFTFWTTLFTLHTLVVMAYFYAERRRREHGFLNVNWILILAFAALFFIFGAGMCGSSLQFAFENTTTIENLSKRSQVFYLAVYVPETILQKYYAAGGNNLRLITYPRPPAEQVQMLQHSGAEASASQSSLTRPTIHPPLPAVCTPTLTTHAPPSPPQNEIPPMTRTFAILETKPGANPFDLGHFENFKEVMGHTIFDWFFPLRPSPCATHDAPECMYKTGKVVYKLRKDAGILDGEDRRNQSGHRKKKRRRRSSAIRDAGR